MTDQTLFADAETTFLRRLAGAIISAAKEDGLPGADDEQIFARLLRKASGREASLRTLMTDFLSAFGGIAHVAALDGRAFHDLTIEWQHASHPLFATLLPLIAQAYYEDPRVLIAHGKPTRPPFPEGHVVVQGDWSLLNGVRRRPPFYRQC